MAAEFDIQIDAAGYYARTFTALAGPGETPWDLTGCALAAQVRRVADGPLIAQFQIEETDLAGGTFALILDDRERLLPGGTLQWDLIITDSLGIPHKILYGRLILARTITRL
jgi:hypothetical protein